MKKTKILGTALIGALLFSGCAQTAYTDGKASQVKKGDALTLGLDRQDFESAAETMINSMLSDPAFANIKPGTRKVIAIGRVVNDTRKESILKNLPQKSLLH